MFDINLSKKNTIVILFAIFILGLILRLMYFSQTTFGYDQARDAFMSIDILSRDPFKVTGPNTDIFGINHGVLFWYLLSPFYFFSGGNVFVVKIFLILVNLSAIFILYYVAKKLLNNDFIALLSCFIYALSFESVQYANWLSNPSPALITSLITLYSFWLIIQRKDSGIYLFLIIWPLSVHFEFFLVYHFILFIFLLIYANYHKRLVYDIRKLLLSLSASFFIFIPFFIEQLKYNFRGIRSLVSFLSQDKDAARSFIENFNAFFDKLVNSVYYNIGGFNLFLSGFLLFIIIYYCYQNLSQKSSTNKSAFNLIILWFIAPLILFSFERFFANFIMIGNLYGIILLFSIFASLILKRIKCQKSTIILILFLVLVNNLYLNLVHGKKGTVLFSVQKQMILKDELSLIDWVYKESQGEIFAINTITNPLFINTTWAYLFNWYGKSNYDYMPAWLGYPQVDVFGGNVTLGKVDINTDYGDLGSRKNKLLYLIIEPEIGIPKEYIRAYKKFENQRSKLIKEKSFGNFVVEKRKLTSNLDFSYDELFSLAKEHE